MPSAPSVLDYFMDAYLGVERSSDIDHALRAFAKEEGSERVNLLRRELQNLLGKESSTDKLSAAISKVGRYAIAPDSSPRLFLVKLFERSQLVGASEPYRRPFDAFVSHSHSDAITAKRLVVELERAGFKAWLDDKEILAGHDIVEEVFRGIGASDFLLVLLSKAAVASRWVQRELNAAFLREMERKQVVVIPVLLEQCEVPQQLLTKKHVDLARSWDEGVRLILASLEGHRANRELREISREIPTRNETTKLMSFYQRALTDVGNAEWPPTEAFKDVAIGPLDNEVVQLPKEKLLETIRSFRVSLQNWGGESFPYDEMSSAEISNFSNGVRLIDRNAWPYSDWSFFYWRFEEDCFFAQRSYLYEDHSNNLRTPERLLSAEWVAKDVCTPLMFAHRLSLAMDAPTGLGVHFEWSGIENRNLVSLDPRRSFFRSLRRCAEDRFQKTVVVERESNLLEIALATIGGILWLFGVENFRDSHLADQVPELLAGRFPR